MFIAFIICSALGPPDIISQIYFGAISACICAAILLILGRIKAFKSSPNSMITVVCILACIVSILSVETWLLYKVLVHFHNPFPNSIVCSLSSTASFKAFSMGNLWIVSTSYRSNKTSEEIEYVFCSVDIPESCRFNGSTLMFNYSDGKSVGASSSTDSTGWIDEKHELTWKELNPGAEEPPLGAKEVSLLHDHRYDEEFNISSFEELMTIVNKLKDERANIQSVKN